MSGRISRPIPRQLYDFNDISSGGGTLTLLGAKNVDVSGALAVVVVCRLHSVTWPSGATVTISARIDAPTSEDPNEFVGPTDLASVTFTQGTDVAPAVKIFDVPAPYSPYLRLFITGALPTGAPFQATLSVDVSVRGDDRQLAQVTDMGDEKPFPGTRSWHFE